MAKKMTASDLDAMVGMQEERVKTTDKKVTARDLDALVEAGDYTAPENVERPLVVSGLQTQKQIADYVKSINIKFAQGAVQGFGDEGLAALKTGSISSPEYVTERDINRQALAGIDKRFPVSSAIAEGTGSVLSTAAVPGMAGSSAARLGKELISAGIQGAGDAPEMRDIPKSVGTSMALQGAAEVAGKLVKNVMFDDPTKILTRSIGVSGKDMRGASGRTAADSVERLRGAGFFESGGKYVDPDKSKFIRDTNSMERFLKPQTLESLNETAQKSIIALKAKNNALIANKTIKPKELTDALNDGIAEMTFDPTGYNVDARTKLAQEVKDVVLNDLVVKGHLLPSGNIKASAVEEAKRALDAHMGSPAFQKSANDLGINPEAMMLFRKKMDSLVDNVGGPTYKKNNDLMSDLITVRDVIQNTENRSYVEAGNRFMDNRSIYEKMMDAVSPTPVDIARSSTAAALESPGGELVQRIGKRTVTNEINQGRKPQSVGGYDFSRVKPAFGFGKPDPMEVAKMRLPRTTEGLIQNKEMVISKLMVNGVPDEMIAAITQALNEDPDAVGSVAAMMAMQFPTLFEKSKYKMFDGKILDPQERAKAADETSKRDDLNSLQKAKIINEVNKTGKWIGE